MMAPPQPPLGSEERAVSDYLEALRDARNGNAVEHIDAIEAGFVAVAKSFGQRMGIEYGAWRDVGVGGEILRAAGIGTR